MTPNGALWDAPRHYRTRFRGSEMTTNGVMSRWLGWAGWVDIFEYKGPRTRVASARLVPSRTRPRGDSRQGTLPPPIGTLITMRGCDDWPARGVGNDAKRSSLGRYSKLEGTISGVGHDAKCCSLGRYAPLQDAIPGVGNDAECGSLGRYSPLQDVIWGGRT